jgi:hypothetical protein
MADQVEVTKLNGLVTTGPGTSDASITKLVDYLMLEPGEGAVGNRQGHVHSRIIVRSS